MALFTWLYAGALAAMSATCIVCNVMALVTRGERPRWFTTVSYTHLTLPTILRV